MQNLPLSNYEDLISFIKIQSDYNKFDIYNIDQLIAEPSIFQMIKTFYSNTDAIDFFDSISKTNPKLILDFKFQDPKVLIMSKDCLTYKKTNAIFFDNTYLGIVFPYKHNTHEFTSKKNDRIEKNIRSIRNHFSDKNLFIENHLKHQILANQSIEDINVFPIHLENFKICEYSSRLTVSETPHTLELCLFTDNLNFNLQLFYNLELIKKHSIDIDTYNKISEVQLFDTIYEFLFPFSINSDFFNNLTIEMPTSLKEYMEVMEPYRDTYKMYKI